MTSVNTSGPSGATSFDESDGDVGRLMSRLDWTKTPLGALDTWSPALRSTLRLMLPAQAQIVLFWGPDYLAFYNDAYTPTIGTKHPRALGRPAAQNWSELWSDLLPLLESVRTTGKTIVAKDRQFYIERHGYGENVTFDISYSAVRGEGGNVEGVMCIVNETTERIKKQRHTVAELDRLSHMFDRAPGFMALLSGPELTVQLSNKAHQDLIGQRHIIGRPLREALPEFVAQGFADLLDRVFTTGETHAARAVPVILETPTDREQKRWIDFVYQPVKTPDGKTSGIFIEGNDVTNHILAIRALNESEERLRLATEGGAVGTWDFDPVTGKLRWDQQCKRLFGLSPDAQVSYRDSFLAAIHPDDRDKTHQAVEGALADGGDGSYDVEYRAKGHEDGIERWLAARGRSVFENGKAVRFVGTVTDITKIKQAEAVIADLNRTLSVKVEQRTQERDRIWQVSQDLLGVAGRDGIWRSVNPAWTRVLGWPEDQIVGRTSEWLEHPDDAERTRAEVAQLAAGRPTLAFENRFKTAEGEYRTLSWTAVPVEDEFYCVARDVTDAKRSAAALEESEDRLRQAQKMETVGQLSGGIAHDFNNILQIVTGNLEILQRNLPLETARLRRAVDNAMTGAKRAATLTQRLLAFSRRQPLTPTRIDPNALVSGMSELLHRTLGETIAVETVLASNVWKIEADANQLESAILNLAVNARDAMPNGGKLVIETTNLSLERNDATYADVTPGPYVAICVSDAGEGIDKETLPRVFEPFFTTKDPGRGTGLGLSMVYGFVKQSGGHVKIYSERGRGTTVKLYLPRLLSEDMSEPVEQATVEPRGGRETILVCEDDDDVRAYSVTALRELGYRVLEAHDADTALRLIERPDTRIDLLFSDVILTGGKTGADLAREAKAKVPSLRILFTTGYARNAIVHHGRLGPGLELLTKPFTYADLSSRIREILDKPA